MSNAQHIALPRDLLSPMPDNPNRMTPSEYAGLLAAMRQTGTCVQSLLVRPMDGGVYEIIDGAHRWQAAGEAGVATLPCIVVPWGRDQALAWRLGMNRNRGHIDLAMAGADLEALVQGHGWSPDEMAGVTGFGLEEIGDLLSARTQSMLEDSIESITESLAANEDKPVKPFVLEITFATKEEYQLARRKLKKAAGKGNGLDVGLLNVLGER